MMRRAAALACTAAAALICAAAACSHAPPPAAPVAPVAAGPATAPPAAAVAAEPAPPPPAPEPAAAAEPAPPPPTPAPAPLPPPLVGPVPGAPSVVFDDRPDPTICGGHRLTVRRVHVGSARAVDPELLAFLTLTAPTGLDFDPAPGHEQARRASARKFSDWFTRAMKTGAAARALYMRRLTASGATPTAKIEAIARLAILERRFGDMVARMEIPAELRTGPYADESTRAFCDELAEKAQPLWQQADEAAATCAEKAAALGVGAGWWTAVCAAPPPADPAPPSP